MRYQKLGRSEIEISAMGLGCMGLTHAEGAAIEKAESIRLIREAVDMGYTLIDTAQCYNGVYPDGSLACNEIVVGEALKGIRDKVVLATKFGVEFTTSGLGRDSNPATIRESVESSLRKLRTDYIDLYYQHRVDPSVPIEEVAGVISELIKEGKIRTWGMSMVGEEEIRKAYAVCPLSAVQNMYSMTVTDDEKLFPVLKELGITYVSACPLSKGLLSGAYSKDSKYDKDDFRSRMKQFTGEGLESFQPLLDVIAEMAAEKHATNAQIALAWMMCNEMHVVPIPGSRKLERIRENGAAGDLVLSGEEMKRLDEKIAALKIHW